jgi:hypothetical protein
VHYSTSPSPDGKSCAEEGGGLLIFQGVLPSRQRRFPQSLLVADVEGYMVWTQEHLPTQVCAIIDEWPGVGVYNIDELI